MGRDNIIYYLLEYFNRPCYSDSAITCTTGYVEPDDGTWLELTSYSDTANRLAGTKTHSTGTFFFPNQLFDYRMRAKNGVGIGFPSSIT